MFLIIYNIYVDSVIFIRKNVFFVLPFVLYEILNLFLRKWLSGDSLLNKSIQSYIQVLNFLLIETFAIAYVYKKDEIIDSEESLWQIFSRVIGKTVLLFVYSGFVFVLCAFILALLTLKTPILGDLLIIPVGFIIVGTYPLSLRHLIYYNNIMVVDSIKAGLKDLYKNFFFYLFIVLLGILVWGFPSLISPSNWLIMPILPLAEFAVMDRGNEINWLRLLMNPILSSIISVALTYAFIFKNKKNKHVS